MSGDAAQYNFRRVLWCHLGTRRWTDRSARFNASRLRKLCASRHCWYEAAVKKTVCWSVILNDDMLMKLAIIHTSSQLSEDPFLSSLTFIPLPPTSKLFWVWWTLFTGHVADSDPSLWNGDRHWLERCSSVALCTTLEDNPFQSGWLLGDVNFS